MNSETTEVRRSAVYLWGALLVLAWALLSIVWGGGEARADDEPPAPLSGLTSLVGDTLGEVVAPVATNATSTVEHVASPVLTTVEKAVATTTTTVASAPIVGSPAAQVITKTGDSVSNVTQTVEQVAASAPVSAIVTPVTGAVSEVPVVGAVLDGLGVTDLIDQVATGADEVLAVVPPVIDAIDPVVDSLQPGIPSADDAAALPEAGSPAVTDISPAAQVAEGVALDAARETADSSSASTTTDLSRGTIAVPLHDLGVAEKIAPPGDPRRAPAGLPRAAAPTSALGGSGGSGPGASSDTPSSAGVALEASSRAGIPADAALPGSPATSADVFPD